MAELRVCRHWSRSGQCLYGDSCKFQHTDISEFPEPVAPIGDLNVDEAVAWHLSALAFVKQQRKKQRNPLRKGGRAGAMRRWLLDTFGGVLEDHGVLDVAGGDGELAFQLANLNRVDVIGVDPASQRLDHSIRKLLAGFYHRTAPLLEYITCDPPLGMEEVIIPPREQREWTGGELDQEITASRVIVGLHLDEVTEGVIDFALNNDLGFAVVPCCVFWKSAPHRSHIKTYPEFIKYLVDKSDRIRVQILPFQGRNIVLYALPVNSNS